MNTNLIRNHLAEMLTDFAAHLPFADAVKDFPWQRTGEKVEGLEHSMWMLVEHIRIVNRDLIDWVCAEEYHQKSFPGGYWPDGECTSEDDWNASVAAVSADLEVMKGWAEDKDFPLFEPLDRRESHSASREILLAIAHNGYHIAQIVDLRFLLGVPVKDW